MSRDYIFVFCEVLMYERLNVCLELGPCKPWGWQMFEFLVLLLFCSRRCLSRNARYSYSGNGILNLIWVADTSAMDTR